MKKVLIASVSAIGLMGLAACSDVDDTTTQGVEPMEDEGMGTDDTGATMEEPAAPAEEPVAPAE